MKRFFILTLIFFLIVPLFITLTSCQKEIIFGPLLFSEEIDNKTLEAINTTNIFEAETEQIYSVIKYTNANNEDNYFFVWTNIDTGEKTTSDKYYLSNKENLESGNLVSVLKVKEGKSIITPGKYKVEMIYNGKLKATSGFEILRPELKIISAQLANKINEDGSPSVSPKNFKQTDIIYLCIEVNYILKGHTFKSRWFDEKDELIKEYTYDITEDDFKNNYIAFELKSSKGIFTDGNYKVEIYLDDVLFKTLGFNIIKTDLSLSEFSKKSEYANEKYGFSFLIPDNWRFLEFENKGQFQVQIIPPLSNMEIGFLFMLISDTKDVSEESLEKISDNISQSFISEKNLEVKEVKTSKKISEKEIEYYEILKLYKDKNNNDWLLPFCFITKEDNLYILYGIINETTFSREITDKIFYGIINSISFN